MPGMRRISCVTPHTVVGLVQCEQPHDVVSSCRSVLTGATPCDTRRMSTDTQPVRQLRLVVEATDFDAAVAFYRDILGLPEELAVGGPEDGRVVILDAGRATLELANPAHKRYIDELEVGREVAPRLRVCFEVGDT